MASRTAMSSPVLLLALLLSCIFMSSAARRLEEAAPKEEFPPHLIVPELPVPEHELPPKPELPPFLEEHLPEKTIPRHCLPILAIPRTKLLLSIRRHPTKESRTHARTISDMVSKSAKTLVLLAALLLACAGTSSASRNLEEAAPEGDEHPAVPELPVPEHELPPLPKVELPPKPELPPFPEVHLPPFPKVELPPKPEMPGVPEFYFPEPEVKP
ncbi:protein PELPK1-like [Phragmites australis]|uniref:protein PELPK1-like n=1 Tax=Phragmites australis TaxID=29695 RepID=UPI002D7A2711|nr:protein PELPK1-like [Phragmites australis]